jgi:hypothetical protein
MVIMSLVDRGLDSRSGQTNDYQIGICCFPANHTALSSKSTDLLARNLVNVLMYTPRTVVSVS